LKEGRGIRERGMEGGREGGTVFDSFAVVLRRRLRPLRGQAMIEKG